MEDYSFYKKTSDGHRGEMLTNVISLTATIRWNEVTKWTLTGAGLNSCPLGKGSEVVIYRGESAFLSGFVTEIEDSYDAATGIYDWSAECRDDLGKLSRRLIYPDPAVAEVKADDAEYTAEGPAADVLLELIRRNASNLTDLEERRIVTLKTAPQEHVGEPLTITSGYAELLEFVLKQLQDGALGIRSVWDGQTGVSEVQIYLPNDVSRTVIFSVEAGSLAGWTRKRSAPKANVILAGGVEITDSKGKGTGVWQTVVVSDSQSVSDWGRYELYIDHSDISPIEEKDDDGKVISTESWEDCAKRLRDAALNDLIENSAQDGYELAIVELERMAFKTHWDIGDTVSVRIADTELKAPIEEIKVEYSGGIETVTPSIGELQKGELQSVFDELGELKKQITLTKNSEPIRKARKIKKALKKWAHEYEEEEQSEDTSTPTTVAQCANRIGTLRGHVRQLRENIFDVIN